MIAQQVVVVHESGGVLLPLLAAAVGAVLGGAATFLGSFALGRVEQVRAARIELFDVLTTEMPTVLWPPTGSEAEVRLAASGIHAWAKPTVGLGRASLRASRRDRKAVHELGLAVGYTVALTPRDANQVPLVDGKPPSADDIAAVVWRVQRAEAALRRRLDEKLHLPVAPS